jgi:type II secretory pathway pseudopilin PulG
MSGEAIGYALPGMPMRGIGKIGLANPEPVKKLVAACAEFAAMVPPGVTIKKSGEKCSLSIDPAALDASLQGYPTGSFELWVESNALVVGLGEHAATSDARPGLAPFAREILDGSWLFAAWGQGSMAGAPFLSNKAQFDALLTRNDLAVGLALWAIYHLNEFGVAGRVADDGIHGLLRVRTLWANPDEVVSAVEEKIVALAGGDVGAYAAMAEVAKKHPGSPFARDIQAGGGGIMAPIALVGIVTAVSIPAFVKYQRRGESTEAMVNLRKLERGAREHYIERSAPNTVQAAPPGLPGPSAGPTPPLGTCCQQGGTCQPSAAWWDAEPWKALRFSMDDPHRYSYEYRVEPAKPGAGGGSHSFTVLAYGDLDCDGTYSTFSMRGLVDASDPYGATDAAEITRVDQDE